MNRFSNTASLKNPPFFKTPISSEQKSKTPKSCNRIDKLSLPSYHMKYQISMNLIVRAYKLFCVWRNKPISKSRRYFLHALLEFGRNTHCSDRRWPFPKFAYGLARHCSWQDTDDSYIEVRQTMSSHEFLRCSPCRWPAAHQCQSN